MRNGYEDKCPVCGNEYFQIGDTYTRGDFLYHECECEECGSTWKEKWVFYGNIDIEDNRVADDGETTDTETVEIISAWQVPKEEWHT